MDVVSRRSDRAVFTIRDDFDQARCTDRYIDVDKKATGDGDGGSVPTSSAAPEFWGAPGGTTAPAPVPALAALAALAAPAWVGAGHGQLLAAVAGGGAPRAHTVA